MIKTDPIADLTQQRNQFLQFVRRRVESSATAEDILQGAYARAMEKSSDLRSGESAVAWFYRILRNAVIDHYRHRAAEDRALNRWAQDLSEESTEPKIEEIVCKCIGSVLADLRPAYSEVLREVDLDGKSLEIFAKNNGISAGNAAVRAHRARQAFKKQLIQFCGTCSKDACLNCTCA
jgi:RNA polymerase sigma-70 factor (ECF subfamily)